MARFTIRRYEQILAQMISKVVARTKLSDVADSGTVKNVLAAAARADDEQYYQMSLLRQVFSLDDATGTDLDERVAEIQPSVIRRNGSTKSAGNVVFYRSGVLGTVTIGAGAQIKTADNIIMQTTAASSLAPGNPPLILGHVAGQDSGLVPAVALKGGIAGNVAADTLTRFGAKPPGVDGVTNPAKFTGGNNQESDDALRARAKRFVNSLSRGTPYALESAVLDVVDPSTGAIIKTAKAVEDIINRGYTTLYIDDGTGSAETSEAVAGENVTAGLIGPPPNSAAGGETVLALDNRPVRDLSPFTLTSSIRGVLASGAQFWMNSASAQINFDPGLVTSEVITANYTRYTGLIAFAQKIVDGDPLDRVNYPGIRAAGTLVWVRSPQVLVQNIAVYLTIKEGYDPAEVPAKVRQVLVDYINSLNISDDVLLSELIRKTKQVAGVYDCNFTAPTNNRVLLDEQIARTTASNVAVS